jgi:hypothetical protein
VKRALLLLLLAGTAAADLTKNDVRPTMKRLIPLVADCYAGGAAVILDLALAIESDEDTRIRVRGFTGDAPEALRDCLKRKIEATVFPAIARGHLDITYPLTFAARAPDNRGRRVLVDARRAAGARRWKDALALAERGLTDTALDGTVRRPLIEIAGVAACHLKDRPRAHRYMQLASQGNEQVIRAACAAR